ncbi:MAG: NAD(P)/FAD-dependent oxidoreductase [Spirochaetia bacterium]|nr:NAD(P)/FAD-dependent oxidoreductase [Spirochaetia bacterium]
MYDIAIIGAGVIGAAIARELSRYQLKLIVVDKGNDVCAGTSKANSSIVHAGYDPEPGTLMAKLNSEGNPMFDKLCKELSVPFNRCGSYVVAFTDEQVETLKVLLERGKKNGIPGLEIVDVKKLLEKEPAASPDAKAALYAPTAGVVDPMLLTTALMENAVMNGADYKLNYKVDSIEKTAGGYIIHSDAGDVEAKCVINAAGVYSDIIHNMVAAPDFSITPKIGQ